jgi:hypothetical protein
MVTSQPVPARWRAIAAPTRLPAPVTSAWPCVSFASAIDASNRIGPLPDAAGAMPSYMPGPDNCGASLGAASARAKLALRRIAGRG